MITITTRKLGTTKLPKAGSLLMGSLGGKPKPGSKLVIDIPPLKTGGAGGGFDVFGPKLTFKTPNLPPEAYDGPSLLTVFSNWIWGPPPVIEAEVLKSEPEAKIDISNCMKLFLMAVLSTVKDLQSAAEDQAKAKGGGGDKAEQADQPDPTGVVIGKAHEDLRQAEKDFANCIKKGASDFDAFCSICRSEAKSMIDSIVKNAGTGKVAITGFQKMVNTLVNTQNGEIARIREKQSKVLIDLQKERDDFNKAIGDAHDQMTKHKDTLSTVFTGATKGYTDIVKDTDGLTRVLPSVVKAIEQCCKTPDDDRIAAVSKALKSQVDEVVKTSGKDDKAVKTFVAEVKKFEQKWL